MSNYEASDFFHFFWVGAVGHALYSDEFRRRTGNQGTQDAITRHSPGIVNHHIFIAVDLQDGQRSARVGEHGGVVRP